MIVLVARYQAKVGQGDAVVAAMREMAAFVHQFEPGCLLYQVCRSNDDPDTFLIYEQYANEAALEAHRETLHFQSIVMEQIVPLLERRERDFYTLVAS